MKTLYLHIGTPKTATSSIQIFCRLNRGQLHQYGYDFPILPPVYSMVRIERNAHFLIDASPKVDASGAPESEDDAARRAKRQRHLVRGLDTVHKAFRKYDNVILSDEGLWLSMSYNQRSPLDILCEDAEKYDYRVKVIVYLRRQDQFVTSRWNQFVKEGSISQTFQEYLDDMFSRRPLILDYAGTIDNMASKIGKENCIVRRFEPSAWIGGSVYTDFLDAAGLASDMPMKQLKEDANFRLTLNYTEIQREINAEETIPKEQKEFLCSILRQTSDKRREHPESGLFSAEETREFLARYEEGNARLAKEYLGEEGGLFSPAIKDTAKWTPDNAYMEEDRDFFRQEVAKASQGLPLWKYRCKHLVKTGAQKVLSRF